MKKINTYIKVLAELNEQIDAISTKEVPAVVVFEDENGKCYYREEVFGIYCNYIQSIDNGKLLLTSQGKEHYYLMGWISKDDRYYFKQINDNTIHSIVSGILYKS